MFDRQRDICPVDSLPAVTLIGAGGIGSRVAEVLVAMGIPRLVIYDDDVVERVNLGPQFYRPEQLGVPKVVALERNLPRLRTEIEARVEKYIVQPLDTPVVILALDSLRERARIWRIICRDAPQVKLVIDGRMGWDALRVYFVPMDDSEARREYAESLSRRPLDLPCTARAVAYNVFCIAGIIAAGVRAFALGGPLPRCVFWDLREWFVQVLE